MAVYPRFGILYLVRLLGGRNLGSRFPGGNWTPHITVQADPVFYVLESAALRAPVNETLDPVLVMAGAKELTIRDALLAVRIPAGVTSSLPHPGPYYIPAIVKGTSLAVSDYRAKHAWK